jgi:telomerase Cajal body protein 1
VLSTELVASYSFVNATTEAYISPHSLLFTENGQKFIGGSNSLLAIFDLSRPGNRPLSIFPTTASRKGNKTKTSIDLKGIVSALSIQPASNILAAGTFSRQVGLYDAGGQGECLGVFRVDSNEADDKIGGRGVTQLMWSPCGRYLYIAERQSCGIMVYDIRKSGHLLSWVEGRKAQTNQRLGVDLSHCSSVDGSLEIWAGGIDGNMRMWSNTHCQEGSQQPDLEWYSHNGKQSRPHATGLEASLTHLSDAVSSTFVHPSASVIASCSGQRHYEMDFYDSSGLDNGSHDGNDAACKARNDNSLKIWSIRST